MNAFEQDLARQKQVLADKFMNSISQSTSSAGCSAASYATEAECIAIVDACLDLMGDGRANELSHNVARNVLFAVALAVIIDMFVVIAIQRHTFAHFKVIRSGLCNAAAWKDFGHFLLEYLCKSKCCPEHTSEYLRTFEGKHRASFFIAFLFVAVFCAACTFLFLVDGTWIL